MKWFFPIYFEVQEWLDGDVPAKWMEGSGETEWIACKMFIEIIYIEFGQELSTLARVAMNLLPIQNFRYYTWKWMQTPHFMPCIMQFVDEFQIANQFL